MRLKLAIVAAVLSGCSVKSTPVATESVPPPVAVARPMAAVARPTPPHVMLPPVFSADTIFRDAETYRDASSRYVAWKQSKAANIEKLAELNADVFSAVKQMQASRSHGTYSNAKILDARIAVGALGSFLAHKQD